MTGQQNTLLKLQVSVPVQIRSIEQNLHKIPLPTFLYLVLIYQFDQNFVNFDYSVFVDFLWIVDFESVDVKFEGKVLFDGELVLVLNFDAFQCSYYWSVYGLVVVLARNVSPELCFFVEEILTLQVVIQVLSFQRVVESQKSPECVYTEAIRVLNAALHNLRKFLLRNPLQTVLVHIYIIHKTCKVLRLALLRVLCHTVPLEVDLCDGF
jgi:hypothetical protein